MGGTATYVIADEPRPGPLSRIAVNPLWPLFAIMFGGAWLSWPWFVINAHAVGCPARKRTLALVVFGWAALLLLLYAVLFARGAGWIPHASLLYLRIVLVVGLKLAITYYLYLQQAATVELYEYYEGPLRNGILVVFAGYMIWNRLADTIFEWSPALYLLAD